MRDFRDRSLLSTAAIWWLVFVLSGLLALAARNAHAQDRFDKRLEQLALEVAVVAAHEGALDNLRDTALVWQVVEARARTTSGRLAFLRSHSGRALGLKPCNEGNCAWSTELLRAPSKTPESVDAGYWRAVRAPQWELVQRKALGLVYGTDADRPCPSAPYTWGGAMDIESAWLKRRLVPMGCHGTLNEGFRVAPKTLRAVAARGR